MNKSPKEKIWRICVGPEIKPSECPEAKIHKMEDCNDLKPYNGIINWRCPKCFDKHREIIRKNKLSS